VTDQRELPEKAGAGSERFIRRGVLRELARAPDSYGLLLVLLFVDYLILSIQWSGSVELMVSMLFIGLTALLAFHTSGVVGLPLRIVIAGVGAGAIASIVAAVSGQDRAVGIAFLIMALLVLACPVAVVSRVVRHVQVTAETLMGAISVYILIGLVFAYLDMGYQFATGNPFFVQSGTHDSQAFVYFSFITMTTVGYGDLSPSTGLPRTLAVLEALTGQVFLVVLVSRLVALYTPIPAALRRAQMRERLSGARSGPDNDLVGGDPTSGPPGSEEGGWDESGSDGEGAE
jgi:hypothetical protein